MELDEYLKHSNLALNMSESPTSHNSCGDPQWEFHKAEGKSCLYSFVQF